MTSQEIRISRLHGEAGAFELANASQDYPLGSLLHTPGHDRFSALGITKIRQLLHQIVQYGYLLGEVQ